MLALILLSAAELGYIVAEDFGTMYQTRRCRRCGVRGVFFLRKLRKWQADDFALGMFLAAFVIAVIAFGALLAKNPLQLRLTPAA